MVTAMQEIERKYEAPVGVPLPDLTDLPKVAARSADEVETLDAVYYDTAGFDLVRAGITLRQRTGGHDAGWHLKVPESAGVRTELRLPSSSELPEEFTELLTARLRGRPLRPVARIATTRRRYTLEDSGGSDLAEVALDAVTAETFGRTSTLTRWNEVEVELAEGVSGGLKLLEAADRSLRRGGLRPARHGTKLELALSEALSSAQPQASRPPQSQPSKSATAGDALLRSLRSRLEELTAWDLLVRRDAPDSVHRMRVAARRMRAVLQEFRPLLRAQEARELISELRWLGEVLGRMRDEEVLGEHLSALFSQVPAELAIGPVQARISGHFEPRRAEGRRQILQALGSDRYLALLNTLEGFLAAAPLTARAGDAAAKAMPDLVARSYRRVRRREHAARDVPTGPARDAALHEVRKAVKRARYAAEVASPVVGKNARKSVKSLKRLQSVLGDHHDAVIASQALRQLALDAYDNGENTFTYGLLHERETALAEALGRRAHRTWKRANRRKRTAWMGG